MDEINNTILEQFNYIIFNKKTNQSTNINDKNSIFDSIQETNKQNLQILYNLDQEHEGLIILSDDFNLKEKVSKENLSIRKEYMITLDKDLEDNHKKQIEKGVEIQGEKISNCAIKKLGVQYLIKINETQDNQIEEIFKEFDYKITSLKRTKIAKILLQKSGLKPGKYKKIPLELLEKKLFI